MKHLFLFLALTLLAATCGTRSAHPQTPQATHPFCDSEASGPKCEAPEVAAQGCVDHVTNHFCALATQPEEDYTAAQIAAYDTYNICVTLEPMDSCWTELMFDLEVAADEHEAAVAAIPSAQERQDALNNCCGTGTSWNPISLGLYDPRELVGTFKAKVNGARAFSEDSNTFVVFEEGDTISTAGGWTPAADTDWEIVSTDREEFICDSAEGCVAVRVTPNGRQTLKFRNADIASTDEGWVIRESDGWTRLL